MKIPGFCHQNANCINTEGNFSCACLKGYAGDGQRNCSGIAKLQSYRSNLNQIILTCILTLYTVTYSFCIYFAVI